jgi:hypothetical protein
VKLEIPFEVNYRSTRLVPLDEVIDTLVAIRSLINDSVDFIPLVSDNVTLDGFYISVRQVSQNSPLREVFLVTLFLAFQDDIKGALGQAYQEMTGQELSSHFEGLLALIVMTIIYYGVGAAKDIATQSISDGPSKRLLNMISDDVATMTGKSKKQIIANLKKRYEKEGKRTTLAKNVARFFGPSKQDDNSPVLIGRHSIPKNVIAEVPSVYILEHAVQERQHKDYINAVVRIHAMDKDRSKSGWAATVDGVVDKRVPLKLFETANPESLWGKETVHADITVVSQWNGNSYEPKEIHIHEDIS